MKQLLLSLTPSTCRLCFKPVEVMSLGELLPEAAPEALDLLLELLTLDPGVELPGLACHSTRPIKVAVFGILRTCADRTSFVLCRASTAGRASTATCILPAWR